LLISAAAIARPESVHVQEGTIGLPTYALGEEDPNPPFPLASQRQIYPYTMLDDLTDRRELKTYRAVFLENEYLKAIILPDLGGRLYSLYDKVARREVFYRNNVVKYGLVALRGAWISGGIEFNFPNGHTVVTVSPVLWQVLNNPDSSATVVVGGTDRITEMHWEVGLTLRPGQARLEQRVTLFNSTPLANLYWYWANAAVPATEDMQFIYPMREANPHSRTEVWSYPLWQGVDYSWYKDVRQPTSLFGRQVHRNFFGAFYHDSDYGIVHVAHYREVPGKKIWSWGVAGDGLIWTDLLTDHDGPYNEIQSGRYETQLNQEFMPPRRVESWTEYWYPVHGLEGGIMEATSDLALNVRFLPAEKAEKPHVEVLVNPVVGSSAGTATLPTHGVTILVLLGDKLLHKTNPVDFHAGMTEKFTVPIEDVEAAKAALVVEIAGSDERPILRWSAADPVDGNRDFVPAAGVHSIAPKPADKMTVDELFLYGVLQEKDGQPEAALRTYQQVLERDPVNIPALLKLAWQDYRAANMPSAENRIAHAISRNSFDPAVHYAAGVIYRASGRLTLAQDALWASIQYGGPPAPAYAQLGEISIQQKNYDEAAKLLRQALNYNPEDALAWTDLAEAVRLSGYDPGEAVRAGRRASEIMPLLANGLITEQLAASRGVKPELWELLALSDPQSFLEAAAWFRSLGDLQSSDLVLEAALKSLPPVAISPLVYYYLASNAWREGNAGRAADFAAKGASASTDKVFPQRLSDALVLAELLAHNSADPHIPYFLGNFFFAHGRYDDAAKVWLQALGKGFDDTVLERNLGVYDWHVKGDLKGAAAYYERAIELAPASFRLYLDLDEIYAQLSDTSQRVKLFAAAPPDVRGRDTVRARRALLSIEQQEFDRALAILKDHHFKPWEGGEVIRQIFVQANLRRGMRAFANKDYAGAEQAFRQALEYPVNLGVGKPDKPHEAEALYWLGEAFEAQHKADDARDAWQKAAATRESVNGVAAVFRAAALRRLGQEEESLKTLTKLAGPDKQDATAYDFYVAGLAEELLGREDEAQNAFGQALALDRSLWQARVELHKP
jgi:tetratricopeptide (TPR) repeat protein